MALLADYAITPDVFDIASYASEEVCGLHLGTIRRVMTDDGVVRDLRAGEWRQLLESGAGRWHRRAKEIVKKLAPEGRLIKFPAQRPATPKDDREWCDEALATHRCEPITGGVIATRSVKDFFPGERLVERIDLLERASWWKRRSPSVRLDRKLADYRRNLGPVLRYANSLVFIDPYLHPDRRGYREFPELLADAGSRSPAPLIQIHRVCYVGSGSSPSFPSFEPKFRKWLGRPLRAAGLSAEVFIWDDFHDRYLLSNLIGISLPNGLDTSRKPDDHTTWTRLGRDELDDVLREFEPASQRHTLRASFKLP